MNRASVVIPVYGQWALVKKNVDSLLIFDKNLINEILIINDCSPESNPYHFDKDFVKVINNQYNFGYSGTVNVGLKMAKSDIIILLDSDAYPIGPFIQEVIHMYNQDPTVGCIGFKTVDNNGNDTGNYQYEPSLLGFIGGQQLQHKLNFLKFWRNQIRFPNSCAVSFRKACIEEVGYFDEKQFPVLEADVDLNIKIYRSRWKLIFTKDIIICHKGGHSYKVNYKRVLLYHASRWKLLKKYHWIPFPLIAKASLLGRIATEIAVLKALSLIKSKNHSYNEKIKGRKILLKEVSYYT